MSGSKLVRVRLQLRIAAVIFSVAAIALIVNLSLLQVVLDGFEKRGIYLPLDIVHSFRMGFIVSFAGAVVLMAPFALTLGILTTFPLARAIRTFSEWLGRWSRGDFGAPCSRRTGTALADVHQRFEEFDRAFRSWVARDRARLRRLAEEIRSSAQDPAWAAAIADELEGFLERFLLHDAASQDGAPAEPRPPARAVPVGASIPDRSPGRCR